VTEKELFSFAPQSALEAENTAVTGYSYWKSTFRIFGKNRSAVFFSCLIAVTLVFTFVQPLIPGQKSSTEIYNDANGMPIRNRTPDREFIFGTNSIGQDLWSRTWHGARTSLFIGLSVAMIEAVLGIVIGILWGYVRRLDAPLTELYNVCDNIPRTLLLILLSYVLRPGMATLVFAMSVTTWLTTARFIRNQVIIIRDRDYNLASRCLGTPVFRVIIRNLLPYLVSVITLRMALAIPYAIGEEVFISYIGLGLPLSIPSLGNLINSGIGKLLEPALRYQLIFPTVVLSIVTVSFYIIGNAFADASDPRNHVV